MPVVEIGRKQLWPLPVIFGVVVRRRSCGRTRTASGSTSCSRRRCTSGGDLDADPRVVTWRGLPGAVDRPDASRISEQLRAYRPDLEVVDLRS